MNVVNVYNSLKDCHQWALGTAMQLKTNGRITSNPEQIRQNQGSSLQLALKSSRTFSSQNNSDTILHKQALESRRTKLSDQNQPTYSVDDDFVVLEDEGTKDYTNDGTVQIDMKIVLENLQKLMGSQVNTFDLSKHIECYESNDTGASLESGTVDKSCDFSNTREITASENSWSVYLANAASRLIGNACGYFFSKKGTV